MKSEPPELEFISQLHSSIILRVENLQQTRLRKAQQKVFTFASFLKPFTKIMKFCIEDMHCIMPIYIFSILCFVTVSIPSRCCMNYSLSRDSRMGLKLMGIKLK